MGAKIEDLEIEASQGSVPSRSPHSHLILERCEFSLPVYLLQDMYKQALYRGNQCLLHRHSGPDPDSLRPDASPVH